MRAGRGRRRRALVRTVGSVSRPATPATKRMLYAAVSDRTGDQASQGQGPAGALVDEHGEVRLLGDEAEQQRHAGHRGGGDDGHHQRRPPAGAGRCEPSDVAGAGWWSTMPTTMNVAALKAPWASSRMQPAMSADGRAPSEHRDHEAELADGAVGEQQLEIGLAEGAQPTADHRDDADGHDDGPPQVAVGVRRREAGDQVDARLSPSSPSAGRRSPASAPPSPLAATCGRASAPTS